MKEVWHPIDEIFCDMMAYVQNMKSRARTVGIYLNNNIFFTLIPVHPDGNDGPEEGVVDVVQPSLGVYKRKHFPSPNHATYFEE